MTRIAMIGTYHFDPDGESRLNRTLTDIAPDLVICEGGPEKQSGYEGKMEMFRQRLPSSGMSRSRQRKWLDIESRSSYENRGARKFCEVRNIPFFYFGDSCRELTEQEGEEQVRIAIEQYKMLNPDDFLEFMRRQTTQQYTSLNYILNTPLEQLSFLQNPTDMQRLVGEGFGPRDKEMEDFLRPKVIEHPNATIVTVNGFNHILRDPQGVSLYCRIRDLKPERRLIG